MRYPCLILKSVCTTQINLTLYREGISEDGEPMTAVEYSGFCNYQDSAKTVLTSEKKLVQISAQAYFIGDIAPDIAVISGGEAVIFGEKRRILQGTKARNPDGTVNYTRVDMI